PTPVHLHPSRENVLVAGWGKTDVKEPASSTLQDVELRIVEPRAWSHFPAFDHNLQLCVGHPQSTKSAFKGDMGGALLCAGVAQGIVSYRQSNANPPAVFTLISHYRPWIDEVLKFLTWNPGQTQGKPEQDSGRFSVPLTLDLPLVFLLKPCHVPNPQEGPSRSQNSQ
ncbi:hypothetical protein FD754_023773, partial [Muntiacus muntjak]